MRGGGRVLLAPIRGYIGGGVSKKSPSLHNFCIIYELSLTQTLNFSGPTIRMGRKILS